MKIDIHTHKTNAKGDITSDFQVQNIIFTKENALLSYPTDAYYSLGLHPWYLEENIDWQEFERLAATKNVLAIGECGLDKAIQTPLELQIPIFIQQIRIAEKLEKPMIIHCVRAYNELLAIIKQEKPQIPIILHGFNKNLKVAEMFFEYKVYFSFFIKNNNLKENTDGVLLREIFLKNKLFLETDTHIGTDIAAVYNCAAQQIGVSETELEINIDANFKTIFGFKPT